MDLLLSPVKEVDEFQFFRNFLREFQTSYPAAMSVLVTNIDPVLQEQLQLIIQTKTVTSHDSTTLTRKVVKAKRKVCHFN